MAVYTPFEREELEQVCASFGLGTLKEAQGIPQGSINTNYRLETTQGRYFMRHTTVRSAQDLQFEADLLRHLHASAVPVPALVWTPAGQPFVALLGGRVSVFHFLAGEELTRSRFHPEHAVALGRELGKMHRVGNAFGGDRPNPYGPELVGAWLEELAKNEDLGLRDIARESKSALSEATSFGDLVPRGVIHADLFMDNVKWIGVRVSAFFDFEMACREALVLDLAITLNAWCFDGSYDPQLCRAMVTGYQEERALTETEVPALYNAALFGAVRYTASRIRDFHLSKLPPDRLFQKDYRTYLARVRALKEMGRPGFAELVGLERTSSRG